MIRSDMMQFDRIHRTLVTSTVIVVKAGILAGKIRSLLLRES